MDDRLSFINESIENERKMSRDLLKPLFKKMGYDRVYYLHGPRERGKDLVLVEKNRLDEFDYTVVIVKKGDVNTAVARIIRNQIQEADGSKWQDPDHPGKKCDFTKFFVVVSGEFKEEGKENLSNGLRDDLKRLISTIDGHRLVELIEKHMPVFFHPEREEIIKYLEELKDSLIGSKSLPLNDPSNPRMLTDLWVAPTCSLSDLTLESSQHAINFISQVLEKDEDDKVDLSKISRLLKENNTFSYVIEGPAGIGKSTIVKILLTSLADETSEPSVDFLPVFIKLREFGDSNLPLDEFLDTHLEERKLNKSVRQRFLKSGMLILGLDGLDEVLVTEARAEVVRKIEEYLISNPLVRILVSTRDSKLMNIEFFQKNINFIIFYAQFFEIPQIVDFITKWTVTAKEASVRFTKISKDPSILEIASRPLILTLLMILLDENKPLPKRRALVYHECVKIFLDWDRRKGMKIESEAEEKKQILTGIAYNIYKTKGSFISQSELKKRVSDVLKLDLKKKSEEINRVVKEIKRSEIIIPIPPEGYTFLYQTVYEFLLAKFLFDNSMGSFLLSRYHDNRLKEVILFFAGLSDAEINPMLKLLDKEDDILFQRRLLLHALSQEIKVTQATKEQIKALCEEVAIWNRTRLIDRRNPLHYFRQGSKHNLYLLTCLIYETAYYYGILTEPISSDHQFIIQLLNKVILLCDNYVNLAKFMSILEYKGHVNLFPPENGGGSSKGILDASLIFESLRRSPLNSTPIFSQFLDDIELFIFSEDLKISNLIESCFKIGFTKDVKLLRILKFLLSCKSHLKYSYNDYLTLSLILNVNSTEDLKFLYKLYNSDIILPSPEEYCKFNRYLLWDLNNWFIENASQDKMNEFLKNLNRFDKNLLFAFLFQLELKKRRFPPIKTPFSEMIEFYKNQLLVHYTESETNLYALFQNVVKRSEFRTYQILRLFSKDFYQKLVQIAKNELSKLTDKDLTQNPDLFLRFEEGRVRIREFLKNSKPKTKEEHFRFSEMLNSVKAIIDDYPLYTRDIHFDLLLRQDEREFVYRLSQLNEQALKDWISCL